MVGENRQKYVLEFDLKCPEDSEGRRKEVGGAASGERRPVGRRQVNRDPDLRTLGPQPAGAARRVDRRVRPRLHRLPRDPRRPLVARVEPRAENEELKEALAACQRRARQIHERQERKTSIATRYQKKAPQLGGFLEQNASSAGSKSTDSVDRPDVNHGKQYVERHTVIHLKNTGMRPIARFLESLEKSEYPVSVTRLNIRKRIRRGRLVRTVEIGVSTFDRNAPGELAGVAGGRRGRRQGDEVMEKWKALLKRIGPKLGYPAFYLLSLVIFLSWTFPYEKLKDRIVAQFNAQQRNTANRRSCKSTTSTRRSLTGVKLKGIRLISPATEAGKPPSVLSIDEARARVSLLGLIAGNKDVSFHVDAFDGTIERDVRGHGKARDIDITFDGVDIGRIDAIAANIGFPLDGQALRQRSR